MEKQDIVSGVNEVFCDEFELSGEDLVPEAYIFDDLGLDSLDVVDLIVALQKKFGVQVRDDERVREVRTLQDLYDYLARIRDEQLKE